MFIQTFARSILATGCVLAILTVTPAWAQEAWMVVTHEVDDFDDWKEVFDQALATRRSVGETASYTFQNLVDRNMITVWFEWDSMDRARDWASDPVLANGMTAAGVVSTPLFTFHEIGPTN